MKVLQLTVHFPPNVGGVETHLSDLVKALVKRDWEVFVLTYRPLTIDAKWDMYEKEKKAEIFRIPWLPDLFYKLVKTPILEFIYLLPGLFLAAPFVLFLKKIDVIHAHGLVAGFVGVMWGRVFNKKVVISTHSIYGFPKKGIYRKFAGWIFGNANFCLGLSKQAAEEISSLGISPQKVSNFTYWIDLDKFKAMPAGRQVKSAKWKVKRELGWKDKFTALFVGRLVEEKGVLVLLESVKSWDDDINLKIIGSGPLQDEVERVISKYKNVEFLGVIDQNMLPLYYNGSDILIVPSTSEEGFGRVILESLSCGTPVIGSRRGAISEAMDDSVGKLINVSPNNIKDAVEYFFENPDVSEKMKENCRKFAERRYSEENVQTIIKSYSI